METSTYVVEGGARTRGDEVRLRRVLEQRHAQVRQHLVHGRLPGYCRSL